MSTEDKNKGKNPYGVHDDMCVVNLSAFSPLFFLLFLTFRNTAFFLEPSKRKVELVLFCERFVLCYERTRDPIKLNIMNGLEMLSLSIKTKVENKMVWMPC